MKNYRLELTRDQLAHVILGLDMIYSEIHGLEGFEVSEANCQDAALRARALLKVANADAAGEEARGIYDALVGES